MTPQEQELKLSQNIIDSLCHISERPDGWLPHIVFVEEEGEDGYLCYVRYNLSDYRADGTCTLQASDESIRQTNRNLSEINIDWLVTLWNRYVELSIEQKTWKDHAVEILLQNSNADENSIREFVEEHWQNLLLDNDNIKAFENWQHKDEAGEPCYYAFIWSCHHLDRNISDVQLLEVWRNGPSRSTTDEDDETEYEVERLTLDELAERINDECFNDTEDYVRFIQIID
ncbi:hypothetical protein [uncultured Alistipes sp.]|uniref:hypothetical protein n=1 Tax=uncultured Alistipes sp. TaxID=538949 RepID=UPI00272AB025|nr:hypothetical protein [uncultured Alistipes sp.]